MELNYYETFHRNYDAQIGRFTGIDIMAEKYCPLTPYQFGNNNPVYFNDPDGDQYSYMGHNGNKWHGPDLMAGTAAAGTPYQQGYGPDGFGNVGVETADLPGFWRNVWETAQPGIKYVNTPGFVGETKFNIYTSESGIGVFETENDYGTGKVNYVGELYNYTSSFMKMDFGAGSGVGQPGALESAIPIWGSGRAAVDHFQNGNYWRGIGYTALAVSDVFLVKSLVTGLAKGGIAALGKNYKTWGSWRKFYGREGYAARGQHLHHWLLRRNGQTSGGGFAWWAKNQMWNLMPMKNPAFHTAVHGNGPKAFNLLERMLYGTPSWLKSFTISSGGRMIDEE